MDVWKLNACPKCRTGALFLDRDTYGSFITCSNCGWHRDLAVDKPLPPAKDNVEADREGVEDGCNVASSCFLCPLPDCLWETPNTRRAYLLDQRALAIYERLKSLGTPKAVAVMARDLNVTERTIYRALKRNATNLGDSNG
jgi:hypothetical protein